MKFMRGFLLAAGLLFHQLPAHAQQTYLKGIVVSVRSGDSMTINTGQDQITVRLAGVAAPFMCQPEGKASRQTLLNFALGKPAHFVEIGRERDRIIAQVIIQGRDTATHLLQRGTLWPDARDNPIMQVTQVSLYTTLYAYARKTNAGIFAADPLPTPPWDWARKYGRCDL